MSDPVRDALRLGQSIWYDNIRRGLLDSGKLKSLIDQGVTGVTSNPSIFEKAIAGSTDYDEAMLALAADGRSADEIYERLVVEDIRTAADLLRTVHDATEGADGFVSLEVSPALAHEAEATVAEAERLFATLDRPNVMIKVPGTPEGITAIRRLIGGGINVNVTLIFATDAYRGVAEAYLAGLEDLAASGGDLSRVASVASFFVSRVDSAVDPLLDERARDGTAAAHDLLGKAAVSNAKLAYQAFRDIFGGPRFAALRERGARAQRPLWASTGTKNPAYSDLLYVESLIGADTVNTVPPATLAAYLDHGRAAATLERDVAEAEQVARGLEAIGVSMERVTDALLADGLKSFADAFDTLMTNVEEKRERLLSQRSGEPEAGIGERFEGVEEALADLRSGDVVGRIWQRDHTVWKPDPTEITDRLGWLTVTDLLSEQAPALRAFAAEVRDEGYRHVVLLGMGGSSLGPEVLRQTFGSAEGYPELAVLDSTVPAWVRWLTDTVDPARTLFLVSSKSGGTIETLSGYRYFRSLVEEAVGKDMAGRSFVAITDPDTPLAALASGEAFRRVFVNPPDIGGRYSVLSYFGLVPAALIGVDLDALLSRADCMREGAASCVAVEENPAAYLGATMAALAQRGRDKLTIVASPSVASFGLWAEQLIAESTGKEGKGIVPVAGERLGDPDDYGDDRLFVHLRMEGDANDEADAALERIRAAGHPVVTLALHDRYDLGAEFFRWELATAVAGAVMGINPFDQPNVQEAKDVTAAVLREYQASGSLPTPAPVGSLDDLLAGARPGDYLAIMAYVRPTPEADRALSEIRARVMSRHRIATTVGYGPRFLHSTGQLHKGGPTNALFLQVTADHESDVPVPGAPYTFGVLADAQALGDLRVLRGLGRPVARVHLGDAADLSERLGEMARGA